MQRSATATFLLPACVIVATLAFLAYTRTLLPGVDLGDTGGFQAAVLWPDVSARQAYPLYYALARPFVRFAAPDNPARALNLFSAVTAALAVGLLGWLTARITASIAAGAVAALLLAFSYTFWSQAIIAEVYGLHLALIAASLIALHAYDARPATSRLLVFLAIYAVSFGNHLSMILLFPAFALFLLRTPDQRARHLQPQIIGLAALAAVVGALQYAPNALATWYSAAPDAPAMDRLAAFWFDTTKSDWRESMVFGIRRDQALDRLAMWWFDLRQQFGIAGIAIAAAGASVLWRRTRPWATLLLALWLMTTVFALTYNVGDTHVFFLPAHLLLALFAGTALTLTRSAPRAIGVVCTIAVMAYAGWRAWDTWPAVDRHDDRRAEQFVSRLTLGLSDRDALLVSGMNWQLENALLYSARHERRDLAWVRIADVLPYFPFLAGDNHAVGRDLVLTAEAAAEIAAAYGNRFAPIEDPSTPSAALSEVGALVPRGSPYVLAVLTPPREEALDADVLSDAIAALTGGRAPQRMPAAFEVMAGLAGDAPVAYRASERPFRQSLAVVDELFTIRMDSWLPSDTFRRPGFGHVLRGREHALILERGVNLMWLERDGSVSTPFYAASLYAPKPRLRIPAATLGLAGPHLPATGRQARGPQDASK